MSARRLFETAGPLIGLLFVSIIFGSLIGPRFFNGANLELIARQTAIVCTTARGAISAWRRLPTSAGSTNCCSPGRRSRT